VRRPTAEVESAGRCVCSSHTRGLPRQGEGGPEAVAPRGLTGPVPGDSFPPLSAGCPCGLSTPQETSSGHAVVPKEREPRTAPHSPSPHPALRPWPYNGAYPQSLDGGTPWDLVGQVFSPFSPGDPTKHPACPLWRVAHPTERSWSAETAPPSASDA
jgi:hypothetical protein